MEMERRDFLKGAAVGAMGMLPLGMVVGCSPAESGGTDEASAGQSNVPEMSQVVNEEGRLLTLDEVNQLRRELVDSQEDYAKEDGTVVPALYVKVRALIHSTGMGIDWEITDQSFDAIMMDFTEEQAEAYLEMPWGVHFTATDFAAKARRDETECYDLCEKMGYEGLLHRTWKGGVPYYYTLPEVHGIWEYGQQKLTPEYIAAHRDLKLDRSYTFFNAGTPNYYSIPLNKDVVAEDEIRLQFEQDTCAKCGTCEARCPLYAISMNDEGYPQIAANCISCGQCAYVCPTQSRKLVQKDLTDFPELPEDYLEDANQKAEFRFRNELIS